MANLDSEVRCSIGNIDIPKNQLTWGQTIHDITLTGRIGVCEECQRKWREKVPGALKTAPLAVVIKDGAVESCDNAFSD